MLPEKVHGERGNQCARQDIRRQHREYDGFGQRDKQELRHSTQKEHGQEDDTDAKGGNERGYSDLRRALENGGMEVAPFLEKPFDVLDGDSGVIDQNADGEGETAERHDVDGLADRAQAANGDKNRKRDGYRDDDRAAPASEETQNHEAREAGGNDGFADDARDCRANKDGLVGDGLDLYRRRDRLAYLRQGVEDAFDDAESGGLAVLQYRNQRAALTVEANDVGLRRKSVGYGGHVTHVDRGVVGRQLD